MHALSSSHSSAVPVRDQDALVHFAGPWSDEARRRLTALLLRVERTAGAPAVPREAGKRWVCHLQPYGRSKAVFSVSRIGWRTALVAPDLDALLRSIRAAT